MSKPSTSRSFSAENKSMDTSDSEFEESLYEVENKSINTTLPYSYNDEDEAEEEEEENHSPANTSRYIRPSSASRPQSRPLSRTTEAFLNNVRKEFKSERPSATTSRYSSFRNSFNNTNNTQKQYPKKNKKSGFYPEHVSEGLLIVVVLFFVCLICGYIFVKFDNSVFSLYGSVFSKGGVRTEYLLCEPDVDPYNPKEGCYTREEVDKAMIIIHDLYDLLSTRAGEVECGIGADKDMTSNDFRKQLKDMKYKRKVVERLYNACVDHIIKNPHWKLRALTAGGEEAERPSEVATIESTVASKGLMCRIGQSFYRVTSSIIMLLAVFLIIYLGIKCYRLKTKQSDEEQRQVFKMVEDIIDILKEKCDNDSDDDTSESYMAVQHVRDQLLPPFKRRDLQPIWKKAVKFIEDNESRIRLETQTIRGEDFEVWRWIHTVPSDGKIWQGQAFGEHKEATSSPVRYSPTPCLKVKNMFDAAVESDDDWYEKVQNAILEKTEGVADIVHMFVDEDSKEGCVYAKCSSREAAGKARQCLHGWWFDGRLITARYLRLEHYHKQFPDSVKAVHPLSLRQQQPRSSLRLPYYRSTLEMT